ncbi:hypothetical protein NHQ30_001244 [Ciborinia camelliae]|nr:hypothetical protein NHQ30_001244 [Ciborinia camelliae]
MKCNAIILASFALGQSVMASNIYRPGGHFQVKAYNGSETSFPSGTGASSGFPGPTGMPSGYTSSKKPCKTKTKSSSSVAATNSEASVVTSAPAISTVSVSVSVSAGISTSVAPASSSKASVISLPPYPTTFVTGVSSTVASTGFASGTGASGTGGAAYPSSTGALVGAYYQCGGANWKGPTTCVANTHCQVQNPFYSQCIYDANYWS